MKRQWLLLPMLLALQSVYAEEKLDDVMVTATLKADVERITINPKSPMQPIPAPDGAGLLKILPNMSVARKGGVGGEVLFRGLGGSRLPILADDNTFFGGCGGRMDPPTSYVTPDSYDKMVLVKGPQTVTEGPGVIAGAVRFTREPLYFAEPKFQGNIGFLQGSFNRTDASADLAAGMKWGYARLNVNYDKSDDYRDGDGNTVHSAYSRNSQRLTLGATPDENTVIEGSFDRSRGWAAYASRGKDGTAFDRDTWNLRAQKRHINDWLSEIKFEYGHSDISHEMDNFRRRPHPTTPMFKFSMGNPGRETDNARLEAVLSSDNTKTQVGIDHLFDRHRMLGGLTDSNRQKVLDSVGSKNVTNQTFRNIGLYAENNWYLSDKATIVSGLRYDHMQAVYREGANQKVPQNLWDQTDSMYSGFMRYEYAQGAQTYFVGLGTAERFPDFWERNKTGGAQLKAERNTEINAGFVHQGEKLNGSLTVFAGQINNFIQLNGANASANNIDARRYGFEGDISYRFLPNWQIGTTMAYTYGDNRTDNRPLAQVAPFEAKTYLNFDTDKYSAGILWRSVASQHRYATGYGSIAGTDKGASDKFNVFSVHGGWKITPNVHLTAGIDNLFNEQYSEVVSEGWSPVMAYEPANSAVITEPGRQLWARLQVKF